jgi:hypothetical protein
MIAPYGVTKTKGTKSPGVVIVCWDCHNTSTGAKYTTRTIDSHGSGTVTSLIRGTTHVTGPTLCLACHAAQYGNSAAGHGSGSAFATVASDMSSSRVAPCYNCHGSGTTRLSRRVAAEDVHGFNKFTNGTLLWGTGSGLNMRPYTFIRNSRVANPTSGQWVSGKSPKNALSGLTVPAGAANCGGNTAVNCGSNGMNTYGPGGVY